MAPEPGDGRHGLLTGAEAAAYLRVSRATLWRCCQEGRVPALKIGHEWRILLGPVLQPLAVQAPAANEGQEVRHGSLS